MKIVYEHELASGKTQPFHRKLKLKLFKCKLLLYKIKIKNINDASRLWTYMLGREVLFLF